MNDLICPFNLTSPKCWGTRAILDQSSSSKIHIFSVGCLIRSSTLQTADLRVHKVASCRLADVILLSLRSSYDNTRKLSNLPAAKENNFLSYSC